MKNYHVLKPGKDFTGEAIDGLRAEADKGFARGKTSIVFDLGNCSYMNSGALDLVVNLWKSCNEKGGELAFVNVSPGIINLISTVNLDRVMRFYSSFEHLESES